MGISGEWIEPAELPVVKGDELFTGTDATVHEFWRWGFGDLRMNIVRGVLSEFLVAKALNLDTSVPRNAWDNYDLRYGDVTIEVKSAARWQSYKARSPSKLIFRGLSRRRWDEESGLRRALPEVIADIYIFAMHICDSPQDYDPLSTTQWSFFVLAGHDVRRSLGQSVSAASLARLAGECSFTELRTVVESAVRRAADEAKL